MDNPLVSVVTITYNHEPWIAKTIEGVLSQKVDFPIEMIIAEDCSTDGTRAICEEYAERYPDVIRLLPSDRNHGPKENELRAMQAVRGIYIAFCEGDDYWTDPEKLQKQVAFLENHQEYSVCFTRFRNYVAETDTYEPDSTTDLFVGDLEWVELTMELFFSRWCAQPLTMVYRTDAIPLDLYDKYKYYRDQHQIYHLLKAGRGCILDFESGVRVKHQGGWASMIDARRYCELSLPMDKEFYVLTREPGPRKQYEETLQAGVKVFAKEDKMKSVMLSFELFGMNRNMKRLVKNILFIFGINVG